MYELPEVLTVDSTSHLLLQSPLTCELSEILFLLFTFSTKSSSLKKSFHLPSIFLDFKPIPREMLDIWMQMFFWDFAVSKWSSSL